mmetsp:Transcript_11043/g.26182  ORF Transcript_11043/g.26182 Transcript_11043/m.26182 type:complete len:374 (-) Transcript_11043:446-1567(-)
MSSAANRNPQTWANGAWQTPEKGTPPPTCCAGRRSPVCPDPARCSKSDLTAQRLAVELCRSSSRLCRRPHTHLSPVPVIPARRPGSWFAAAAYSMRRPLRAGSVAGRQLAVRVGRGEVQVVLHVEPDLDGPKAVTDHHEPVEHARQLDRGALVGRRLELLRVGRPQEPLDEAVHRVQHVLAGVGRELLEVVRLERLEVLHQVVAALVDAIAGGHLVLELPHLPLQHLDVLVRREHLRALLVVPPHHLARYAVLLDARRVRLAVKRDRGRPRRLWLLIAKSPGEEVRQPVPKLHSVLCVAEHVARHHHAVHELREVLPDRGYCDLEELRGERPEHVGHRLPHRVHDLGVGFFCKLLHDLWLNLLNILHHVAFSL